MEGGSREKRVPPSKTGKDHNLRTCNQHWPNSKRNPLHCTAYWQSHKWVQERTYFLHEYLQLQSGTWNSIPEILSPKITFIKKLGSLSETAYFTFTGSPKEQWLRANSPYLLPKYNGLLLILCLQIALLQSRIHEATCVKIHSTIIHLLLIIPIPSLSFWYMVLNPN